MPEIKRSFFIDVFHNGVYEDEDDGDVDDNDGEDDDLGWAGAEEVDDDLGRAVAGEDEEGHTGRRPLLGSRPRILAF